MVPLKRSLRIIDSDHHYLFNQSCVLSQVVIAVYNPGTSWTLQVQDKGGAPNVVVPTFNLVVPSITGEPVTIRFTDFKPRMVNGIDVFTAGTAGVLTVWVDFLVPG